MNSLIAMKSIYNFIAVAETGSMTTAAERLYVSHSAVSQSIKSLENQIGMPLFDRIGRQVKLNDTGHLYYRKVAPAITQIIEATESLQNQQRPSYLTLNMTNSMALHWWVPRLANFQQFAPQVDIRLSNLVGNFNLEQHKIDAAIVGSDVNAWKGYYTEKLSDDELVLVSTPQFIQKVAPWIDNQLIKELRSATTFIKSLQEIEDILRRTPLIQVINDRRKSNWQIWATQLGINPNCLEPTHSFSLSIQAIQAVTQDLGLLVTHKVFVKDEIANGRLIELTEPIINPHQQFYFVCPSHQVNNEPFVLLKDWLKNHF